MTEKGQKMSDSQPKAKLGVPAVEAIVKSYDSPSHPFAGHYTRISEPVLVSGDIPGDLIDICRTAKHHREGAYAFFEGHRYDLTRLSDLMGLEQAVRMSYEKNKSPRPVMLKVKGHGAQARVAVIDVYHAFISDPEKEAETVENGDS